MTPGSHACAQLTVLDESLRRLILVMHQPEVEGRAVTNLVIHVVQASSQQHVNTALDLGVLLSNAEFGQGRDRRCSYYGIL